MKLYTKALFTKFILITLLLLLPSYICSADVQTENTDNGKKVTMIEVGELVHPFDAVAAFKKNDENCIGFTIKAPEYLYVDGNYIEAEIDNNIDIIYKMKIFATTHRPLMGEYVTNCAVYFNEEMRVKFLNANHITFRIPYQNYPNITYTMLPIVLDNFKKVLSRDA